MSSPLKYLVIDGKVVPYEDARLHITTPAVRYGATAFEGIRAYWNDERGQLYMFRSLDHLRRLLQSARLMGMEGVTYSVDDLTGVVKELLDANQVRRDVHIRPSLFVAGDGSISARGPVSLGVVVTPGNPAMGAGQSAGPFRLCVSSWRRIDDNTMPPRIKSAANYQNARLALIQAEDDGYDGALMLDDGGHVTEDPRAAFFMIRDGSVITPSVNNDILESITRETVIRLLQEAHGIEVVQRAVDRTELYVADEVFLAGTALEVTPVTGIDRFQVGGGKPGAVTTAIAGTYAAAVTGNNSLHPEWLDPVYD